MKTKKSIAILGLVCCLGLCLVGCEQEQPIATSTPGITEPTTNPTVEPSEPPTSIDTVTEDFIVVSKTEDTCLVRGEASGLYTLSLPEDVVVEVGSLVHVTYDGIILESFPMQFSNILEIKAEEEIPVENTLFQAYLDVFEELYDADPGLNDEHIYFDFTKFDKLTGSEKEAFLYIISQKYDVVCEDATMEELIENGTYKENYGFEDCVLFMFKYPENHEKPPFNENAFELDTEKYRGPLAAYGFEANFFVEDGRWTYTSGPHWIS